MSQGPRSRGGGRGDFSPPNNFGKKKIKNFVLTAHIDKKSTSECGLVVNGELTSRTYCIWQLLVFEFIGHRPHGWYGNELAC